MKNLFGLVLSCLLRIGYKVMRVNQNMPSIDHSDFNITILRSLSFRFYVDWHHGCIFFIKPLHGQVNWIVIIATTKIEIKVMPMHIFSMYIRYKKCEQITTKI